MNQVQRLREQLSEATRIGAGVQRWIRYAYDRYRTGEHTRQTRAAARAIHLLGNSSDDGKEETQREWLERVRGMLDEEMAKHPPGDERRGVFADLRDRLTCILVPDGMLAADIAERDRVREAAAAHGVEMPENVARQFGEQSAIRHSEAGFLEVGPIDPGPRGCDHKFVDSRCCLKCGWMPGGRS